MKYKNNTSSNRNPFKTFTRKFNITKNGFYSSEPVYTVKVYYKLGRDFCHIVITNIETQEKSDKIFVKQSQYAIENKLNEFYKQVKEESSIQITREQRIKRAEAIIARNEL